MLSFLISNRSQRLEFNHSSGALRLGRDPRPLGAFRKIDDQYVSAEQLLVEELTADRLRLTNLSQKVRVELVAEGGILEPGQSCEVNLPARLTAGRTLIEIESDDAASGLLTVARPLASVSATRVRESLGRPVQSPETQSGDWGTAAIADLEQTPGAERLARWFETVVTVQRSAASSDAFFHDTARAVVDLIGLDCGLIYSRSGEEWIQNACYPTEMASRVRYSRTVLDQVCTERRTYFQEPDHGFGTMASPSLSEVATVVASPIFGADPSEIVGAVYGLRFHRVDRPMIKFRALEAQLVQVLAAAVGAGLARREMELEAAKRFVQFGQFFSPELARELDRDPSLLQGRDREVTILSSDIRGFSRLSEMLGPRETCELVNQVMERLTAKVQDHGGVVVDYVGDGMLAMWNAPFDQPDHAVHACRAALEMLEELPGLDEQWKERLGRPLNIGVGINTGVALVGNTGSPQKFKYGPLGHTVNLASRVEGATKYFGVPILITGSTHERLAGALITRRLRRVRVAGIEGAVDIYELISEAADPTCRTRRDTYEAGLSLYESARFAEACRTLGPLLPRQEGKYDVPTLALFGSCIDCLKNEPVEFDTVLDLIHK